MALIPFDDRDGLIWMDGAMVPWRDAKLHVLSHGLHYASGVFRGREGLFGQYLPAAGAYAAADRVGPHPGLRDPLDGGGDRRGVRGGGRGQRADGRLCAADRLARVGADVGLGAAIDGAPGDRELGLAQFVRGGADEGRASGHGGLEASAPGDGAHRVQGGGAVHDRDDGQAQGGGRGLGRRADAGLARPGRGGARGRTSASCSTARSIRRPRTASWTASPAAPSARWPGATR